MTIKPNKTRLKILLIILGVVVVAFVLVFYFYGPYSEAAKGGIKGKGVASPTPTRTISPSASPKSPSPSAPVSGSPAATTLFSDNFTGDLSKWTIVYEKANIVSGQLDLQPQIQTYNTSSDTHAPLIVAGDAGWKDYVYNVQMKTAKQLRPSNPNPWEVGWLIFRYVDANNFYYFIHKTNGIELGALVNGTQKFLYTTDTPKLSIGTNHSYQVTLKGTNIKIAIDGSQVVNTNDSLFSAGKIGLYNEDAQTLNSNVSVLAN